MSYLFLFRAYPDVDHIAPLAWKLLERGERVHAVISPGYDGAADPHIRFLARHERFVLHEPWRAGRARRWLRSTFPYARRLLKRSGARLLVVEWGSGPRFSSASRGGRLPAIARRLSGSVLKAHRADPQEIRSNLVLAAAARGLPMVALPHGVSIKLEGMLVAGRKPEEVGDSKPLDWRDRGRFTAYVYDSEEQVSHHRTYANGDASAVQAWGSLRWSPEWFELNRALAPAFAWPDPGAELKVVLMAPKWRNRASADATADLVRGIQQQPFVSLAVKGHPRKEGSLGPLREAEGIDWSRIHDVSAIDSVPLIAASDVVIDVGSSIGLEVVMQGKVLLNPSFLHEIKTVFDVVEGSCVRAESREEALAYLRRHREGSPHRVAEAALSELMRRCVYAGEREPFDVVGRYADRVQALAG